MPGSVSGLRLNSQTFCLLVGVSSEGRQDLMCLGLFTRHCPDCLFVCWPGMKPLLAQVLRAVHTVAERVTLLAAPRELFAQGSALETPGSAVVDVSDSAARVVVAEK